MSKVMQAQTSALSSPWSDKEIENLKVLLQENKYTYEDLANKLSRTKASIKKKIHQFKLEPKPLVPNEIRLKDDPNRVWRNIRGFDGYKVSNDGYVYSEKTRRILNRINNNKGYYHICLTVDGKMQYQLLHRLIAEAFIPNPEGKPFINHIDGNKKNNKIENLEWVTNQENIRHAFEIGLMKGRPSNRKKAILQIDKDTKQVIKEYSSQLEASKELNIHVGSLSQCLNGKYKTAGGYIWRYKEDKINEV